MNRRVGGVLAAVLGVLAAVLLAATMSCTTSKGGGGPAAAGSAAAGGAGTSGATHAGHGPVSLPPPAPLRAGERFATFTLPEPYTPAAPDGATDEYRCFLIDPRLGGAAFLTGSQVLPENSEIVHHAIVFRLDPTQAEAARRLDAGTPGEGWRCFGGTGVGGGGLGGAGWVAAWAPGAGETVLAAGTGFPMPAGSQLVLQVHYNLLGSAGRPAGSDQSGIRLRLADSGANFRAVQALQLAAPVELPCAAGESGPLCDRSAAIADLAHRFGFGARSAVEVLNRFCNSGQAPVAGNTQHCDRPVASAGTIYALAGHMHLLGRSIRVELNPGTPGARTLLDVPVYNFDNQALHPLPQPVPVKAGDTLRVTCTHDATLRRLLPQLRNLAPRYVVWGDGTSDEMCLGLVVWAPGGPA
jgi:hypothetical protein